MYNVIAIDAAPSLRKRVYSPFFYTGATMPMTDLLYEVSLPIGDALGSRRTLIHLVSRAEQTMRFVVSDLDIAEPAYTTAGADIPQHYEAREVGEIGEFLQLHSQLVDELLLAGAAGHGQLTLARAAHAMVMQQLPAEEALAAAADESQRCEAMVLRQQQILDSYSQ